MVSKLTWIAAAIVATLGVLSSSAVTRSAKSTTTVHLACVQVLTDRLHPIQGAIVKLEAGSSSQVVVTDGDGQSPWRDLDPGSGVALVLADHVMDGGVALGLIEDDIPPTHVPAPSDDYSLLTISRTQPLAIPVQIEGLPGQMNNIFPPSGDYPHWRFAVPQDSNLRLAVHVASLMDWTHIEQYLKYRGASSFRDDYVRGVVLLTPGVQLGSNGFFVGIALLGDLRGGVVVDAFNFATNLLAQSGPALSIETRVHNDVAYVYVKGGLRQGHLALLARPVSGSPAQRIIVRDSPPNIVVPPNAGEGVDIACEDCGEERRERSTAAFISSSPLVTDCEPDAPRQPAGWSCPVDPPPANHCGAPIPGPKQCEIVRSRSPKWCKNPGSKLQSTTGRTASWRVSFFFTGAEGTPLSSAGGFEYGKDSTTVLAEEWVAQSGDYGFGECMRYYNFDLACAQKFTMYADACLAMSDGFTTWANCTVPFDVISACDDHNSSMNACSRTP